MTRTAALLAILTSAVLAAGCAPYLMPYGGRAGYAMPRPNVFAPQDTGAAVRGRWDNVMRLPASARIDALTWDGEAHVGAFSSADGSSLRILVGAIERQIPRAEIVRVDLTGLPGSEAGTVAKRAGGGALLGMGAIALVSVVIGGGAWPPPAAALRAGAAYGAVAGGHAALLDRQRRVVYLAESLRTH